ncbi:DegT/DnrJ/EryC1/StrS family aminotransferase [Candidatus Woesearchaeota archaeon]|nr:DegT/DnrJ/EryC1/StrS family aminotransferase [Candidatus Woesearchaeota archaeon]
MLGHRKGDFSESERASKEVLSLPIGPHLEEEQIRQISDKIKEFYS